MPASRALAALFASVVLVGAAVVAPGAEAQRTNPTPTATPRTTVRAAPTPTPGLPFVAYNEAHPVLAYYYAWWEPVKLTWGIFQPSSMPREGAQQISDDPALMRKHVEQARAAGIDGFIVNRAADVPRFLDLTRGSDFRVTLQVDTASTFDGTLRLLRGFYQYAERPGLVTFEGRPVLFFWRAQRLNNATWSALRAEIDPEHRVLWIADGDNFGILAGDAWDGISPYAIAWSRNPAGQLPAWGNKAAAVDADKLYIPPVSPGCDDTPIRTPTCVQDRADGAYYQATLDGALASNPRWAVVVSTWNEWLEATQIEPSLQHGDQYLQLTRTFADTFKGAVPAFQPVVEEPSETDVPEATPASE